MKKFFALLCVVAVLTVVNGCKKAEEPATSAPAAEKPAAMEMAPADTMPAAEKPAESMPAADANK